MSQSKYSYQEFSGALQQRTTTHIKKPNEIRRAKNANFAAVIGAICRRPGAQATSINLPHLPVEAPTLGAYIARYPDSIEVWAAQNDVAVSPTESKLYQWVGPDPDDWDVIEDGLPVNAEVNMLDDLGEVWVSTYDSITDTIGTPFTVDKDHDVSTTRQLAYGPAARFFTGFAGAMWAADVVVAGQRHRDRIYKSSGPTGAITFVRSPQTDPQKPFDLENQVPVMTSNTAPVGVASASSENSSSFEAFHVFDRINTRQPGSWITANSSPTGWVKYDFGSGNAKIITHYAVTAVSSNPSLPNDVNGSPKTWAFEGSNDNATWVSLHTVTNTPAWVSTERRVFTTTNSTAYRYYRLNVSANQGFATWLTVNELELLNTAANLDVLTLEVDSARYLKVGMEVEIYKGGTDDLRYTLQITDVDKVNDTISFLPEIEYFGIGDVNTTTDVITLTDATKYPTGTPIIFSSSNTVPAGLTAGTTYYSIYVSSTTIKVATTTLNATIGVAVNITSTGTGNHRVRASYIFGNKDEIWKKGRKGKLTRFWNTDYRNPEASDYIKLPATLDDNNAITAVGCVTNRLFPFTETAMFKFDGQNIIPLRNDVGCVAHRSIAYYDSYMVWLDSKGKIWMRNDEAGQQDIISEAIVKTMALVPDDQLPEATAVCVDDSYKLYLGQIDGLSLRVVYNFRTNQWSEEWWDPKQLIQLEYRYAGDAHPYWFDEKGQMWVDEVGTDDDGQPIPMEIEMGGDTFGVDELKAWKGVKIYSRAAVATKLFASVDDGDWLELGEIRKPIEAIALQNLPKGTMINFRLTSSFKGDTPQIDKITVWYNREEDTFRATK